jgi:two-component system chemotaxis response regulator CheB
MPGHDVVVAGASAGGVEALVNLVGGLPVDLPAAVFVVLHLPAEAPSVLPQILSRAGRLPVAHPADGEAIRHGQIYVAPPDRHLLLRDGRVSLSRGPRENRHRPAVDSLFRTAARAHGRRVVGIVLSGTLDDGTAGLVAVKAAGGVSVIQDPDEALFSGMPRSALEHDHVDHVLPVAEIAALVEQLAYEPVRGGEASVSDKMEYEADIAEFDQTAIEDDGRPGEPSAFSCPECSGVLWELQEGELVRFRCRVGHAYSVDSLLAEQAEQLEAALWTALRALEEKASLSRRLVERARQQGQDLVAARFEEQGREASESAGLVRRTIVNGKGPIDPRSENPSP